MDPAIAACDAILTSDAITSVTGAMVSGATANMVSNGNFPKSPSCGWTLSDGSSIHINTLQEWGTSAGEVEKALVLGGNKVDHLPQPNAEIVYDGEGNVMVGRVGPLLVETLVFTARSGDGKTDDLALLERLAQASAAQPVPPLTVDPECASHLGVTVVGTQRFDAPSAEGDTRDLNCGYDLGDGTTATLTLRWTNNLPDCCDKVKELGKGAYLQQQGSGKKTRSHLEWVLQKGDPALVAILQDGGNGIPTAEQEGAHRSGQDGHRWAVAVATPTPPPSGTGASAEAAAILGTWTFLGTEQGVTVPAGLTVTLTFGTDATVVMTFDCKPPKKKPPLSWTGGYTADATTLDVDWADSSRVAARTRTRPTSRSRCRSSCRWSRIQAAGKWSETP